MSLEPPKLKSGSAEEFMSICDGSFFPDGARNYPKYVGAFAKFVGACIVDVFHDAKDAACAFCHDEPRGHQRHCDQKRPSMSQAPVCWDFVENSIWLWQKPLTTSGSKTQNDMSTICSTIPHTAPVCFTEVEGDSLWRGK